MNFQELPHHVNEDGSLEHLPNWDASSFESELKARKNILKEQLSAFRSIMDSTAAARNDDYTLQQLHSNANVHRKILDNNENTLSMYEAQINKLKKIKQEADILTAENNSLEETVKQLKEKEASLRKEYQRQKKALSTAVERYTKSFDIDITIKNLSDSTYEASLQIGKGENRGPVKFVVDRVQKRVLDFDASELLPPADAEGLKQKFSDMNNIPRLLCTLREIVINRENVVK